MAITEESRHRLFQRLEETLGTEQAVTLMEYLPPVGWADVATKRDLDALGRELRLEMTNLGSEVRGELAAFRGDVRADSAEVRGAIAEVRAELHRELRTTLLGVVGANAALSATVFAVARLVA